ncbi:MAG: gamma-glutamylcyclotransferase [Deltaproteobacteria bacterium]|nr:gamma-glutamylcyclotransferase [Deltaproteobacteria bacterium]
MTHLFVYGTLMRGFSRHHTIQHPGVRFVADGWVRARLEDLGAYPGARLEGEGEVAGELYAGEALVELLPILDEIEGCDPRHPERGLYRRVRVPVRFAQGGVVEAWIYAYQGARVGRTIPEGDWRTHVLGRRAVTRASAGRRGRETGRGRGRPRALGER